MASKITTLSSTSQLSALASKHTIVVIDFHATWCGPCKLIAPIFESLAAKHAAPNRVAFAKADVDSAPDIAQQYAVQAMPTFVILRNRSEVDRVRGADRGALTAAVEKHVRDVKPASGFAAAGKGYTLGSAPSSSATPTSPTSSSSSISTSGTGAGRIYMRNGNVTTSLPLVVRVQDFLEALFTFFALYFVSLFSIDALEAAARSGFARTAGARGNAGGIWGSWGAGRSAGGVPPPPPGGRRLGTVGNLGGRGTIGQIPGGCCG